MNTYAVDFESMYSADISIKTMGVDAYLAATDVYLVSIVGTDGLEWVGHPRDFNWDRIAGHCWVAHNRSFDERVFQHVSRLHGISARPAEWHCTADLAAYLGEPRSLKEACARLLNVPVSKNTRDKMKGKRWEDMLPEFQAEVEKYALDDSRYCLQIWEKYSGRWPEHERELSRITSEMGWRGITVRSDKIAEHIESLKALIKDALTKIPWVECGDPPLSKPALERKCAEVGIPCPSSLAKTSEECDEWLDTYGDRYPWIDAMRTVRRANALLKKLETMAVRTRASDGRMGYELKYAGAHTLRWAGGGNWNSQNLHKEDLFGVGIRELLIPAPGNKFVIADYSQIEPRCLHWLIRNEEFLAPCREGQSPYEVHARMTMGWTGGKLKTEAPKKYALAKARILALGYQAGHHKFISMVPPQDREIFEEPITAAQLKDYVDYLTYLAVERKMKNYAEKLAAFHQLNEREQKILVNSWLIVEDFRASESKVKALWEELGHLIARSVGEDLVLALPSGRHLRYRRVSSHGGFTGEITKNGRVCRVKMYGGLLTENLCQAVARDVFAHGLINLWRAGYRVVLQVHDEVVVECPQDTPVQPILDLMTQTPPWAAGLPVAAEAVEAEHYLK